MWAIQNGKQLLVTNSIHVNQEYGHLSSVGFQARILSAQSGIITDWFFGIFCLHIIHSIAKYGSSVNP